MEAVNSNSKSVVVSVWIACPSFPPPPSNGRNMLGRAYGKLYTITGVHLLCLLTRRVAITREWNLCAVSNSCWILHKYLIWAWLVQSSGMDACSSGVLYIFIKKAYEEPQSLNFLSRVSFLFSFLFFSFLTYLFGWETFLLIVFRFSFSVHLCNINLLMRWDSSNLHSLAFQNGGLFSYSFLSFTFCLSCYYDI